MKVVLVYKKENIIYESTVPVIVEDILRELGIPGASYCNREGKCGKCRVKFLENPPAINSTEERVLSEIEIKNGVRLACQSIVREDCKIFIPEEKDLFALNDFHGKSNVSVADTVNYNLGIAIDLGTTTLAYVLLDIKNGKIITKGTYENHQRSVGADVISRISYDETDPMHKLSTLVRRDVVDVVNLALCSDEATPYLQAGIAAYDIPIVAAANTVMNHFLNQYDVQGLAEYPFQPVSLDTGDTVIDGQYHVRTMPGISAYVGGDILSDIYALDMDQSDKNNILIDLGTNGEMVVGNKDQLLVTSVAAGPAFEGGNISCGMPSLSGAICSVDIKNGFCRIGTINNELASGICGTGVIEAVYEMAKEGIIDSNGTLENEYEGEYLLCQLNQRQRISITQDDIRHVQLAKSAFRTGIDCLLEEAGLAYDDIDNVYIAGGFGYYLDLDKVIGIKMIPAEFKSKVQAVGNASLAGCAKYLAEQNHDRLESIRNLSKEIVLANDEIFQEKYIENMGF